MNRAAGTNHVHCQSLEIGSVLRVESAPSGSRPRPERRRRDERGARSAGGWQGFCAIGPCTRPSGARDDEGRLGSSRESKMPPQSIEIARSGPRQPLLRHRERPPGRGARGEAIQCRLAGFRRDRSGCAAIGDIAWLLDRHTPPGLAMTRVGSAVTAGRPAARESRRKPLISLDSGSGIFGGPEN